DRAAATFEEPLPVDVAESREREVRPRGADARGSAVDRGDLTPEELAQLVGRGEAAGAPRTHQGPEMVTVPRRLALRRLGRHRQQEREELRGRQSFDLGERTHR